MHHSMEFPRWASRRVRDALGSCPVALAPGVVVASVGRALSELSAGKRIFLARRVAVPTENLPATHVVVAVSAPVGIARLCGLLRLLHLRPPDSVTPER